MPAILLTIVNGFTALLSFFSKFFPWLNKFSTVWNMSNGLKIFKFFTFKAVVFAIIALSIASLVFFVTGLVKVYNMLMTFTNGSFFFGLSGSVAGSSNFLPTIFYFLEISGIMKGVMLGLPFIYSAFLFLFVRILYKATLKTYETVLNSARFLV
jgi:hypothetical protein